MLNNLISLTHKIGDKVYHLICDANPPIIEVKDALFQFIKFVAQVEENQKAQQALQESVKVSESPELEKPIESNSVPASEEKVEELPKSE